MIDKYLNRILQGDCLELFKNIPDNSVDMTFADPPFNLQKKYTSYKDNLEFQEYKKTTNAFFPWFPKKLYK